MRTTLDTSIAKLFVELRDQKKSVWMERLSQLGHSDVALMLFDILCEGYANQKDDERQQIVLNQEGRVVSWNSTIVCIISKYGLSVGRLHDKDVFVVKIVETDDTYWQYI